MQSYRAEGYGYMSLFLFFTHFLRYYEIQPANDLRVTSTLGTNLCLLCNETETVPHLYLCQARAPWRHQFIVQIHGHLEDTQTTADIRYMIVQGILNWLLTGNTTGSGRNNSLFLFLDAQLHPLERLACSRTRT